MLESIRLRIRLLSPPPGVEFALQTGKGKDATTRDTQASDGRDLAFELDVAVKDGAGGEADFGGPFVQGPRGARFFYLTVRQAGPTDARTWDGRVKVPLTGVTRAEVDAAARPGALEASYEATSPKGGPRYATVPLAAPWRAAKR